MKKKLLSLLLMLTFLAGLLPPAAMGKGQSAPPFQLSAGEVSGYTENGYTYTAYDPVTWDPAAAQADLYTARVPMGTPELTLTFEEERIAYTYDEAGGYIDACGDYGSGQTGKLTAVVSAGSDGSLPPYVQVQTPYDANWNSDVLYAVQFASSYTFLAQVNGQTLTDITYTPAGYTYYDYGIGQTKDAPVYTLDIPAGTETVDFRFSDSCLAYNYTAAGAYLAGWCDDIDTGTKTIHAAVDANEDGEADYIQVQTPYDENWNADVLYAITFHLPETEGDAPGTGAEEEQKADARLLMENIAASYTESSDAWVILDMAAYAAYHPATVYQTSAAARQAWVDTAIETAASPEAGDTELAKAILALTAVGADAQTLYPLNSSTPVNAVWQLNAVRHSGSAWSAPYTLAAYNQGDYETDAYEQALLQAILDSQQADGSWEEYGSRIQTTANVLAGLSFYMDRDATVKTAVHEAVAYLSSQQQADGSFNDGYGPDANTAAMVVIALAAVGVDPGSDARFVQDGVSALDHLLSFALPDNRGFGYQDNKTLNAYATEQGFRALIAADRMQKDQQAYCVYDFSRTPLAPAWATGYQHEPETGGSTGEKITVTVTIQADTGVWLNRYAVKIPGTNATVYHAFTKACSENGIQENGASKGYVRSITKGGMTLGEFDQGPNSGWLYQVNGELPNVGLTSYAITAGDDIVFYYTTDWTADPAAGSFSGGGASVSVSGKTPLNVGTLPNVIRLALEKGFSYQPGNTALEPGAALTQMALHPVFLNRYALPLSALLLTKWTENPANVQLGLRSLQTAVSQASDWVYAAAPDPQIRSMGGDWAVFGLARSGSPVPETYYSHYVQNVKASLQASGGVLDEKKYTDYARVAIALTAVGEDPQNIAGYNLLKPLSDFDQVMRQGINGPIWALLAFDCGGYAVPQNPDANVPATRQAYVDEILHSQLPGGGWNLTGTGSADPDVTAMALQAFAKYQDQPAVKTAVEAGLTALSALQGADGGYSSWGVPNAESTAQVLTALCELGCSLTDPRFVKNGHSVLDALLSYQQPDGGFAHTAGEGSSAMASEQGLYALAAALRMQEGQSSLYRILTD